MSKPALDSHPVGTSPRAAAVVGILFSVLCIASIVLIRLVVPADPRDPGSWLAQPGYLHWFHFVLHLIPFVGITFLWFMAVLRDRVGLLEDQFYATVFFGSGLMFVAMLFASGAISGGLETAYEADPIRVAGSEMYAIARATIYTLTNVFAIKMAAVFMFVTSAIIRRTAIVPRWVAFVGYGLGAVLLLIITDFEWVSLVFPLWVLLVSACILRANFSEPRNAVATGETSAAPEPAAGAR